MIGFWIFLIGISLYVFGSFLEGFANALHGRSNFGLLSLLILPITILLLPFHMATGMTGPKKRK